MAVPSGKMGKVMYIEYEMIQKGLFCSRKHLHMYVLKKLSASLPRTVLSCMSPSLPLLST